MIKFNKLTKIFIVAEIGVNHEGNFDTAMDLVKKAHQSGVDAVKFQTYEAERYISSSQPERLKRVKKFQLTRDQFEKLSKESKKLKLK